MHATSLAPKGRTFEANVVAALGFAANVVAILSNQPSNEPTLAELLAPDPLYQELGKLGRRPDPWTNLNLLRASTC